MARRKETWFAVAAPDEDELCTLSDFHSVKLMSQQFFTGGDFGCGRGFVVGAWFVALALWHKSPLLCDDWVCCCFEEPFLCWRR